MSYDYQTQIKCSNIRAQLRTLDSAFLSKLTSADLRDLLNLVTSAEGKIREELRNCAGKKDRK